MKKLFLLSAVVISGFAYTGQAHAVECNVVHEYTGPPSPTHANCRISVTSPGQLGQNQNTLPGSLQEIETENERQCIAHRDKIAPRLLGLYKGRCD